MVHSMHHELDQLRRENARLIGLLEAHGIAWRSSEPPRSDPPPDSDQPAASAPGSAEQKVALFRRLFRGRDDVYALAACLASLQRLPVAGLQTLIESGAGGTHPLDLAFIDEEDLATPWKAAVPLSRLRGALGPLGRRISRRAQPGCGAGITP